MARPTRTSTSRWMDGHDMFKKLAWMAALLLAVLSLSAGAYADPPAEPGGGKPDKTECTEAGGASAETACTETSGAQTYGSDPDGESNGGNDKPGGAGGVDQDDKDGNNGCGNDTDFEDDNNGQCTGVGRDHGARRSLTLHKTVTGGGDPTGFSFDIDCDDDDFDHSNVHVDAGGDYTVDDIPVGTSCTISEDDPGAGYTTQPVGRSSTIEISNNSNDNTVEFVNTPVPLGLLRVHKTVVGDGDPTAFSFDIDCDGEAFDRSNIHVNAEGVHHVDDVPLGTTCTVVEDDPGAGWITTPENRTRVVTVTSDVPSENAARFVNTRLVVINPILTGGLQITKTIEGGGDPSAFSFDVDCAGSAFDHANVHTNVAGIYLLTAIPVGTSCTVSEDDPGSGYTTVPASRTITVTIAEGISVAAFVNRPVAVQTATEPGATEVLGIQIEAPAAPAAPAAPQEDQVLGVQIQRVQLPQTGADTTRLLVLAMILIGAGAALELSSRRRRPATAEAHGSNLFGGR